MEKIINKYLGLALGDYFNVILQNADYEYEDYDYYTQANITRKTDDYETNILAKLYNDYISFYINESTPLDKDHIYSRDTIVEFIRRENEVCMNKKSQDRINVYDYNNELIRSKLEKKEKETKKFKIEEKDMDKSLVSDIRIIKSKTKTKKK